MSMAETVLRAEVDRSYEVLDRLLRVHRRLLLSAHNKKLGFGSKCILGLGLANGLVQYLLCFGDPVQGNESTSLAFVSYEGEAHVLDRGCCLNSGFAVFDSCLGFPGLDLSVADNRPVIDRSTHVAFQIQRNQCGLQRLGGCGYVTVQKRDDAKFSLCSRLPAVVAEPFGKFLNLFPSGPRIVFVQLLFDRCFRRYRPLGTASIEVAEAC
jgi:hypothetical protein